MFVKDYRGKHLEKVYYYQLQETWEYSYILRFNYDNVIFLTAEYSFNYELVAYVVLVWPQFCFRAIWRAYLAWE